MLRLHLRTMLRLLRRHGGQTFINIFGLAVGLAAAIILVLFIQYERSYDRFHTHAEDVYRLFERLEQDEGTQEFGLTRMPALPAMLEELPEVHSGTRIHTWTYWLGADDHRFSTEIGLVDSGFFDVFSFEVLRGEARTALTQPNHILLTASTARKLFGETNPVGETVDVDFGKATYVVTGIVEDPPPHSSVQFEALAARTNAADVFERIGGWYNSNTITYVRLDDGAARDVLEAKLPAFTDRHYAAHEHATASVFLVPLVDLHTREAGYARFLYLLALIAGGILLIAIINFANLSTARSLSRAREVGVRKALGAGRGQLVRQFLGEAVLIALLALGAGLALARAALPWFNDRFATALSFDVLHHGPGLLALGIGTGVLAGLYPAWVLSGFRPMRTLRGAFTRSVSGQRLRKGLIVLQFGIATVLILATMTLWQQIDFMKGQDANFAKENIVVLPVHTDPFESDEVADARLTSMRDELLRDPRIVNASFSDVFPSQYNVNYYSFSNPAYPNAQVRVRQATVDDHYFDTYGIPVTAGRTFTDALDPAERPTILNESAAQILRVHPDAGTLRGAFGDMREVVGVAADFHYRSFVEDVEPLAHYYGGSAPSVYRYLSVRLQAGVVAEGLDVLEQQWQRVYPSLPFSYTFVDEAFDAQYRTWEHVGVLTSGFAGLAVLIACLGLFSLAALATQQRTKEISIRKVLGASMASLVRLLSADLLRLVALAFLIAAPVTYFVLNALLSQHFAHAIQVGLGLLGVVGGGLLLLAFGTVSYHALRTATADPVTGLRYE
jgi:putative ABC transport system permease protein